MILTFTLIDDAGLRWETQNGCEMAATQVKTSELQSLLEKYLPQPYRYYRDFVSQRALQTLAKARVRRLVGKIARDIVVFAEMGKALGAGGWSALPIDSEQFGFGAGRIDFLVSEGSYRESCRIKTWLLEKIVEECRARDVRHLTAYVEPNDQATIHGFEKAGFEMIEGVQTFTLMLRSNQPLDRPAFSTRLFIPTDLDQVLNIARSAYVYDRFHADAALPKETADAANEVWVRNACMGRTADAVVVVCDGDDVVGYASCKVDAEAADCLGVSLGSITTVATAAPLRRKGIGRSAILAALDWFRQHRVEAVDAGIQLQNIPAARLYERCGFQQADISLTFRKLIRKSEGGRVSEITLR